VTVIASDKTGTLTLNRMAVGELNATDQDEALRVLALANDADHASSAGDPLERGLCEFVEARGTDIAAMRYAHPRISSRPFDARWKFLRATVIMPSGELKSYLKGAFEVILERATLSEAGRANWLRLAHESAERGFKVIGLASTEGDRETELQFFGFVTLCDPAPSNRSNRRSRRTGRTRHGDDAHRRPSGDRAGDRGEPTPPRARNRSLRDASTLRFVAFDGVIKGAIGLGLLLLMPSLDSSVAATAASVFVYESVAKLLSALSSAQTRRATKQEPLATRLRLGRHCPRTRVYRSCSDAPCARLGSADGARAAVGRCGPGRHLGIGGARGLLCAAASLQSI